MKKAKENPPWDDGRVISDMNVPGMPWYKEHKDKNSGNAARDLSPGELTDVILGGIGAALLIGFILCAGIALFVWMCVVFL